jgi:hypothetical protein
MSIRMSALVLAVSFFFEAGLSVAQRPVAGPLPVSLNDPRTVTARLEVEQRRAGGPRGDVLARLFREEAQRRHELRSPDILDLCKDDIIGCAEFVKLAEECVTPTPGDRQKKELHDLQRIKEEAALQAIGREQRVAIFRSVLRGKPATIVGIPCRWEGVALRALGGRLDELLPDIQDTLHAGRHDKPAESTVQQVQAREAALSKDPVAALVDLIRPDVECEVRWLLGNRRSDDRCGSEPGMARIALLELRRLGRAEAIPKLKELFDLYAPDEQRQRELFEEKKARYAPKVPWNLPAEPFKPSLRTALAKELVFVIGDLGDRGFERAVLATKLDGAKPLWDQVHEVELQLQAEGQLTELELVTDPPMPELE